MSHFFSFLSMLDDQLWTWVAAPAMLLLGLFLSFKFKFLQARRFPTIFKDFIFAVQEDSSVPIRGVRPLQAFFTSIGGCIGIGNIVAVCTAIKIGGPGALLWMWVAAFLGMIIKYSEVYLGISFRVPNDEGSYSGGPMYYLQKVFKGSFMPILVALLIAFYGTEIYMFNVVTESISSNWGFDRILIIPVLLVLIVLAGSGGVSRVGKICSYMIPALIVLYMCMCAWLLFAYKENIFPAFKLIFTSAFTGHAATGGFVGSGLLLTLSQGVARGCYSGDIGIGYASMIHAETSFSKPGKQAQMAILGVFLDTFVVCTATTLIVVVSGLWKSDIAASQLVQSALSEHFPYMQFFMPILIFLLGYSSMISFFCVGIKCAQFLSKKWGKILYSLYAVFAFSFFSFFDPDQTLTLMSLSGASLLLINLYGIIKLRDHIVFK